MLKQVLDPEHLKSLSAMMNQAKTFETRGEYDKAEVLYRRCFRHQIETLGQYHGDCLITISNLAVSVSNQGRYVEAQKLLEWCLRRRKANFGDDHPESLRAMESLAAIYQKQKMYSKAKDLYRMSLEQRKATLGDDHPDTLKTMNDLAEAIAHQGHFIEAEDFCPISPERKNAILGDDHLETIHTTRQMPKSMDCQTTGHTHSRDRASAHSRRASIGLQSRHSKRLMQNDDDFVASRKPLLESAFDQFKSLPMENEVTIDEGEECGDNSVASRKPLLESALDELKCLPIEIAFTSSDEGDKACVKKRIESVADSYNSKHVDDDGDDDDDCSIGTQSVASRTSTRSIKRILAFSNSNSDDDVHSEDYVWNASRASSRSKVSQKPHQTRCGSLGEGFVLEPKVGIDPPGYKFPEFVGVIVMPTPMLRSSSPRTKQLLIEKELVGDGDGDEDSQDNKKNHECLYETSYHKPINDNDNHSLASQSSSASQTSNRSKNVIASPKKCSPLPAQQQLTRQGAILQKRFPMMEVSHLPQRATAR